MVGGEHGWMLKQIESSNGKRTRTVLVPQVEAIVAGQLASYMTALNRSPQEVADSLDVPVGEVRRALRGGGFSVDFLARLLAVAGITLEDLLAQDAEYAAATSNVVSARELLLRAMGQRLSFHELRMISAALAAIEEYPSLRSVIAVPVEQFLKTAERVGYDVTKLDSLVSRSSAGPSSE